LGFKDARRLTLALLDELMRLLVRNLFIRHAQRFSLVHRHVADAITQIIRPCFLNSSTPAELPLFNGEDHAAPFTQ
jgi:hypothetical protein